MRLALAVLFIWTGAALLWLAFSGMSKDGLASETLSGKPGDLATVLQDKIATMSGAAQGTTG